MSGSTFLVVLLLLLWFSPNPGMSAGFKFVEWILMTLEGFWRLVELVRSFQDKLICPELPFHIQPNQELISQFVIFFDKI